VKDHEQRQTPETASLNHALGGGSDGVTLSGPAREMFEALAGIRHELADMYLGALDVVSKMRNPDRHSLAAHGIRELLEKLPRYLDVPVDAEAQLGLAERVRNLTAAWDRWNHSAVNDDTLTKNGRKLLAALKEFCDGVRIEIPTRNEQAAAAVRGLDLNPIKLPPQIESLHVQQWREIEGFFIGVSHHTRKTDDEEFSQYVASLARFILERLRPRTFDDFAAIDKLLTGEA
jgi:hypothetical protein